MRSGSATAARPPSARATSDTRIARWWRARRTAAYDRAIDGLPRARTGAAWLIGGAILVVYAATLTHGVSWDDSGELAAGVAKLGVVHSHGYAPYVLLGHAFTLLEPFGSAATQANLWSGLAAAAALALVAAAALGMTLQDGAQEPASGQAKRPDPTTILARVQKAKAQGATEVTFPPVEPYHADVGGLDEALRYYDAVVARPVGKTSLLLDDHNISTFYRFEVVERLSPGRGEVKPLSLKLPAGLPPAGANHFYLMTDGGTLTLEGV